MNNVSFSNTSVFPHTITDLISGVKNRLNIASIRRTDALFLLAGIITTVALVVLVVKYITKAVKEFQRKKALQQACENTLQQMWKRALSFFSEDVSIGKVFLNLSAERTRSPEGIRPDKFEGNIIRSFESDPKVFFIPSEYYSNTNTKHDTELSHKNNLNRNEGINTLKDILIAAFATNKELVVGRFGNHFHAITVAVKSNGEFRIIDSMLDNAVNLDNIINQLNDASIKDSQGKKIHFTGTYINTRIQKTGSECMRFATLYAYQIAKKRDLDAFEEVNGAFAHGQLQRFEDYSTIDGTHRMRDASSLSPEHYLPFMQSWGYRALGFRVNRWQDITMSDLERRIGNYFTILILNSNNLPNCFWDDRVDPAAKFLIQNQNGEEHEVSEEPSSSTQQLSSLIPSGDERTVILFAPHKKPIICHLRDQDQIRESIRRRIIV